MVVYLHVLGRVETSDVGGGDNPVSGQLEDTYIVRKRNTGQKSMVGRSYLQKKVRTPTNMCASF